MVKIKVGKSSLWLTILLVLILDLPLKSLCELLDPLNPVQHCKAYSTHNIDECVECEQRFWLKPANPKSITEKPYCQPCLSGCLDCKDGEVCINCDLDHTQRQGSTCELCDSNCVTCASDRHICLTCPRFSSLDKKTDHCSWTFRLILGVLAAVALILLIVVMSVLCKGKKSKPKRKVRFVSDNILQEDFVGTGNDSKAQFISSMDMIGMGNNQTNLSEVDKQTEEPFSHTEDFGAMSKNSLGDRNKKRSQY